MQIRKAAKEDRAKILPLIVKSHFFRKNEVEKEVIKDEEDFRKGVEETFDRWINEDDKIYFIAEEEGKAIGVLLIILDKVASDRASVSDLFVDSEYRMKGVGIKLVEKAETYLKSLNVKGLVLAVHEGNGPAIGLYKKIGFRKKEDDYIYMEKII